MKDQVFIYTYSLISVFQFFFWTSTKETVWRAWMGETNSGDHDFERFMLTRRGLYTFALLAAAAWPVMFLKAVHGSISLILGLREKQWK